jgi:hypothetical protein
MMEGRREGGREKKRKEGRKPGSLDQGCAQRQ